MDRERMIAQMAHNAEAIRALVRDVSDAQARRRPEHDAWSVLDVINHLAYEEVHDFRDRLDLVLHRPHDTWPPGDPARGVTERSRQRELEPSLRAFLEARKQSLAWLQDLAAPDWDAACKTPFGAIKAGDIMAAWLAHDLLHLRQLIELRWHHLVKDVEPYQVLYAGDW